MDTRAGSFLLAAVFTCALNAQEANPLSEEARRAYNAIKYNILKSAEKMPEENYAFKPAPRVRTFGQILGHLAEEHYLYCGAAAGEEKSVDVERTKTTKADIIAALQESFRYCDAIYHSLADTTAVQMIQRGSNRRTRLSILWSNTTHDNSHYGNLVTYLRIKGLVPPSTEGQ